MKRITFILIALLFFMFTSLDMQPDLTAQLNAAQEDANCGCHLKEALKKGDWRKACKSAEDLIAADPNAPEAQDAYLWLGLYHKSQYDFDKSTKYYQKAADLFPNTWASAEATARLGCNYYKLNNSSKSLEYYRKAVSEAKTWQQKKYASLWAKWVHFSLAAGKEQQIYSNCATKSINYYLNSKGIKLDRKKLASSVTLRDGLVSLSEVIQCLEKENIKLKAVKCSLDKIEELKLPIVAVVKPSHMIVIKKIDDKITVYDPSLGEVLYYKKELANIWEGKVLAISSPSDKKFVSLTKKDLDKIFLGTCYCCPSIISDCDGDSDKCCTGGGSGGGPGGGWAGGGPGGGGCCYAMGFPKITVDTTILSLIIRDTPIGYITDLGEDVKVSLTYNSDSYKSGIFGNCWHSNLDTKINENSDLSVTVTRSGGHDDTFTYSGGQYNSPVGVTDKLVKNADDTFTLEFTKSHRKYHYDTHANGGKILSIEDQWGHLLTYQYDENNHLTSITDAAGRVTDIETDSEGRVTRVIDPLAREAIFTYEIDPTNATDANLIQVVDMAGNVFNYVYTNFPYTGGHFITSITEPKGVTTIEYGGASEIWVSKVTNPEGKAYQYGGESPIYSLDPRGNYTSYTSEWVYGDIISVWDALSHYVSYTYDGDRNIKEILDKRGNTTSFTYDTSHNMLSKTDPELHTWSYAYDTAHNMLSATDPRGKITVYEYDGQNNLLSVTEKAPDQTILSTTVYTYTTAGKMASKTVNGKTTAYIYNTRGNLVQITDPEENITTFTYDDVDRKISMTNVNGTTSYEYDNLNRITKITHPDTTYIQNTYTCCGLSQKKDENGNITTYDYDSLGRLTKVTDAIENQTIYTYDSVGNLVSLKDAKGNITAHTYDAVNRLTKTTYPLGDSVSYTYDEEGNMQSKTDGKSRSTAYTYDKNNRLIQISY